MNTRPTMRRRREGLQIARLLMVLSSLSPLFILWAIRGNYLVPDSWFISACAFMAIGPTAFLWLRLCMARKKNDKRLLIAGPTDDHRSHVLVYLFAILLPFYREEVATIRDFSAMVAALLFIVFLFWHLNLHYMNVLFALFGFQSFTVSPPEDDNLHTGRETFVLITRRRSLLPGNRFYAYRVTDTVYLEAA